MKTTTRREADTEFSDVRSNQYYSVEFSVDSAGKIQDKVAIFSTSTFHIEPAIIELMKRTTGNWINHSFFGR